MMYMPMSGSSLLVMLVGAAITIWANYRVKSAYAKYSKIGTQAGLTGADIARRMMRDEQIHDVELECIPGEMTDHYDPRAKVVRLSQDVFYGNSIAALGIAAHEIGHVIQDAKGYSPMKLRGAIYPMASIGSTLAWPLIIAGFIVSSMPWLLTAGICFFAASVVFTLITLPVEFDASRRAMAALSDGRSMSTEELGGARKVLSAAALTYVAAAAVAVMELIRLLLIANDRR
jgi:Zn-dependent membrane protease YugP